MVAICILAGSNAGPLHVAMLKRMLNMVGLSRSHWHGCADATVHQQQHNGCVKHKRPWLSAPHVGCVACDLAISW
jgi:hypothetical protein